MKCAWNAVVGQRGMVAALRIQVASALRRRVLTTCGAAFLALCAVAPACAAGASLKGASDPDPASVAIQPVTRGMRSAGGLKATTTTVSPMRCRTESEWSSLACPSISASEPKASLTDYGLGGYVSFDGETERYVVDHLDPDGVAGYATTFNLGGAPCAEDEYSYWDGGGVRCTFGGIYHIRLYPHTKTGQWQFRVQAGTAAAVQVIHLSAVAVVYATMEKMAGDGQQGVINQALRNPLVVAVKDFTGTEIRYPVRGITPAEITTTLTGPRNAGGSVAFTDYEPGHVTRHRFSLTLGSKEGAYQVTFKNRDTQASAPFTATAKLRDEPEDDKDKEEENGEEDPCETVGDPISLSTGNMWLPQTDYAQAGLSPIEFRRTYNSQGSKSKLTGTLWSTTYDRFVIPATNGGPVRLRRPDGQTIRFSVGPTGLVPQPHFLGKLQQTGTGWRYVDEHQTVEEFDTQGRLLKITDLQGRTVTASYNTQGAMSGVTSNAGGSLTFTYTTFGQLYTLRDHTGRTWTYSYDNYANLVSAQQPDTTRHRYVYADPNDPHNLTEASVEYADGGGIRFAVWAYDAQGRATTNYAPGSLTSSTPRRQVTIEYPSDTLRRVTDGRGQVTEYSLARVNGTGFISSVVGPGFAQCGFADSVRQFDPAMNVTAHARFGRTTRYGGYDDKRQPAFMVEADGTLSARRTDYVYDPRFIGKPTLITEPSVAPGRVKTTLVEYNARGQETRVAISGFHPDGTPVSRTTTAEYNGPLGQLSKVDGPRTDVLDVTTYTYDLTTQRLKSVRDAAGVDVRSNILFNALGQIASETRPNGVSISYTYVPGNALLASVTEQAGSVTRRTAWTYTMRQQVQSITFSDGVNPVQEIHFDYDYAGDLIYAGARRNWLEPHLQEPYITFTRDRSGNVTAKAIQDTRNNDWAYQLDSTFDAYNRVDAVVAANNIIDFDFHPEGTLSKVVDGRSQTTTYGYDDFARLTQKLQPGAVPTSLDYDVHGRQDFVADANQAQTRFEFDDLGNQLVEQSPDRGTTRRTHDTAGNALTLTDANGQLTSLTHDALNRVKTLDRTGTEYDETYSYDGCLNGVGRLCRIATSNGEAVDFEYDAFGNIVKLTNNGIAVGYAYDGAGKVVRIVYPSGRVVNYVHDVHGQVVAVTVTDGGNTYDLAIGVEHKPFGPVTLWGYGNGLAHYRTYDKQYWPRSIDTPGVSRVNLTLYDGNGNLKTESIDTATQRFEYDALDQISSGTGSFGVRSYVHDAVGNRQSMTAAGVASSYGYDPNSNRLATESGWSYERDANGNTRAKRSTDGLNRGWSYQFSPHNRLVAVFDLQAPTVPVGTYRYNGLGQRTQKSASGTTTRFAYGLSPLLLAEVVNGGVRQEYVYLDGIPLALLGVPQPPAPPPPTYSFDVIVDNASASGDWVSLSDNKATGGSYLHIDQTRQQNTDAHAWQWTIPVAGSYRIKVRWVPPTKSNITSQNYSVSEFPGSVWAVNGAGVARGSWVTFTEGYFEAGLVQLRLSEADNAGKQLFADAAQMTLLEARPSIPGRDYKYVHTDHLGTPLAVTDKDKRVVWRATHDPFATATVNPDPDGDNAAFALNLRTAGQYFDGESGMHYNYHRDYDPSTGRYLESDPIGMDGGINTYAYAEANPVAFIDPWGLSSIVTYQHLGMTVYFNDAGQAVGTWDSRSAVVRSSLPGADGPYSSADVYPRNGPHRGNPVGYGPNDLLLTDDVQRGRWLHGGGTGLSNPLAPRQGWKPTLGCTRLQNEDIQDLVDMVRAEKASNPGVKIPYERTRAFEPNPAAFFPPAVW
jgi:RHS repeat-associated protein